MYHKYIKRFLDIVLACIVLFLTFPIAIVIAVLIKLESSGPIILAQERTGLYGKKFILRKFRSMTWGNDVRNTSKENEITKVGKIIRGFSLDEIPQVINVLQGEMSFIGPRPWIPEYFEHMNTRQRQRTKVLPGISGLAQAYGRNSLSINQKINYDLEYVKEISFKEDLKIICLTVKAIFDKSSQEIEKSGIHKEIDILRKQGADSDKEDIKVDSKTFRNELYS